MSDHWEVYACEMDGHEALVIYDHAIGGEINTLPLPNVLKVRVEFDHPSEEGLPEGEEFERLSTLERLLAGRIRATGGAFVGSVTTNGVRYFHSYVAFTQETAEHLMREVERESGRELTFVLRADAKKTAYWEELFPTPEELRVIEDMKVLEALKERGDNPSVLRRIDHWLYFPLAVKRNRCAAWAEKNGFKVEETFDDPDGENGFGLQIYHTGRPEPDEITAITRLLLRTAQELGGVYDGWETRVESS